MPSGNVILPSFLFIISISDLQDALESFAFMAVDDVEVFRTMTNTKDHAFKLDSSKTLASLKTGH